MDFNINTYKELGQSRDEYSKRLKILQTEGIDVKHIDETVNKSINNLNDGVTSFVIYGEPQSGKTELMIALTAKLLDEGNETIIILLNDNVGLLDQNLGRFSRSGITPDPKNYKEILDENIQISGHRWIVFCKKNSKDLQKLIERFKDVNGKIIIDDESDYASPNGKINKEEKTKINELIEGLLNGKGKYIGVTATPARLDLNNTFDTKNTHWVNFESHEKYTGQDVFFPMEYDALPKYKQTLLNNDDNPKYLRDAFFRFLVHVAYLTLHNQESENYVMLIHTSGKKLDHDEDYKRIIKIVEVLKTDNHKKFKQYVKSIYDIAMNEFDKEMAHQITKFIVDNKNNTKVMVINSNRDKENLERSTNPAALFTIAIGGNIVSRGVTFNNLLSMFFTRSVKGKMQQDTYIQRARMFGARGQYLEHFNLTIPKELYSDWHRCFVYNKLALESVRNGNVPVWIEGKKTKPVANSSIDKNTVEMNSGEMSFAKFSYNEKEKEVESIINNTDTHHIDKLTKLQNLLGIDTIPNHLISFIKQQQEYVTVHPSTNISNRSDDTDKENISRARGLIGKSEEERSKYPDCIHHIKIFHTSLVGKVFYKYTLPLKFFKNPKR